MLFARGVAVIFAAAIVTVSVTACGGNGASVAPKATNLAPSYCNYVPESILKRSTASTSARRTTLDCAGSCEPANDDGGTCTGDGGGGGDSGGGVPVSGGSGGPGGSGGGGGQVATLGPAKQGVPCTVGGGGSSAPIGSVIDGKPDTPGPSGNEVNNVFYIPYVNGTNTGSIAGYFGFMVTTFNNETWYEPPIAMPVTGGPIYINMGNMSISPNAPMTAQTFSNIVNQALGGSQNGGLSAAAKSAVGNYLKSAVAAISSTSSSSIDPCFSGPWNGK